MRDKHPGVEAVEHDLEDAIKRHQSSDVVCVSARKLIPHQYHRDTASDADEYQAAHVGRLPTQEDDGKEKHQHRADQPILGQR